MRSYLPRFIFALCLAVAASSGCNENSGGAQQQSGAKPTAAANNANNAAVAPSSAATNASAPGATSAPALDACALLTSDDIKAVQGEAVKESKPSRRTSEFDVAACFYTTPTFIKSVSLEVTRRGGSSRSVHDFWEEQVEKSGEEMEREREAERARERRGETKQEREREREEEREREAKQPRRLKGIGDEAYWVNTNANSTMYVFKKDALLRISIGGTDNEETRMKKIKTLAERALARL
ncbi:MAG TPA: hypothetical protein VF656_02545 [Pyrinomonadaceae bacterium]|jgi:hypothetical protein